MFQSSQEGTPYFDITPLSSSDFNDDSLTLKSPPEFNPYPKRLTIKDYYSQNTKILQDRLNKVLRCSADNFFDDALPDLYSPLWIANTLSLLLSFLGHYLGTSKLDLAYVLISLYTILLSVPAMVFFLQKVEDSKLSYFLLFSIYGYSWVYFIFSALVSFIQIKAVQIVGWVVSFGFSLLFLKKGLWTDVIFYLSWKKYIAVAIIFTGHLMIFSLINMYFL